MDAQSLIGWFTILFAACLGLWIMSLPLRFALGLLRWICQPRRPAQRRHVYIAAGGSQFYDALYPSGSQTYEESQRTWEQSWDLDCHH